jgi:hypothetical protein
MTYSVGGLITSLDYNTFATAASNIGNIWCIGSSDQGYGQLSNGSSTIQTVSTDAAPTGLITAADWNNLIDALNGSGKHQSGTAWSNVTSVVSGSAYDTLADGIIYATVDQLGDRIPLTTLTTQIATNRANAALQGATTPFTSVNTTNWIDALTFSTSVTFPSADQARFFFNAGGQVGISLEHNSNIATINPLIADMCTELGTIWLSGVSTGQCVLAGTTYTGLTQVGGVSTRNVINTALGFPLLTSDLQQGVKQTSDVYYRSYTGSFISISYSVSGAVLTIVTQIDEVNAGRGVSYGGIQVATPTTLTVQVRQPETTFLADRWGGLPTVSTSIAAV